MAFLDSIYGAATRLMPAPGKFFHKGYGNMDTADSIRQEVVKQMRSPSAMEAAALSWGESHEKATRISFPPDQHTSPNESSSWGGWWWPGQGQSAQNHRDVCMVVRSATFDSPAAQWLPVASRQACLRFVHDKDNTNPRRIVIHLPTTGDQFYWMRTRVAEKLLEDGVASIIPMFPLYGPRKPQEQTAHFFRTVSDFATAASAALLEAGAIAAWARKEYPQAELCFTGVSMGGTLASAAAVLSSPRGPGGQRGLAVVPGVGTWSAETFIRGVLRKRIDWGALAAADEEGCRQGTEELEEEAVVDALAAVLRRFSIKSMLGDDDRGSPEPQLAVVVQVSAKGDAFIPADDAETLHSTLRDLLAPGHGVAKMIWDEGGHLSLSCDAFGFISGGIYLDAIRAAFRILESNKVDAESSASDGESSNDSSS